VRRRGAVACCALGDCACALTCVFVAHQCSRLWVLCELQPGQQQADQGHVWCDCHGAWVAVGGGQWAVCSLSSVSFPSHCPRTGGYLCGLMVRGGGETGVVVLVCVKEVVGMGSGGLSDAMRPAFPRSWPVQEAQYGNYFSWHGSPRCGGFSSPLYSPQQHRGGGGGAARGAEICNEEGVGVGGGGGEGCAGCVQVVSHVWAGDRGLVPVGSLTAGRPVVL
jgi:hypothetical protein